MKSTQVKTSPAFKKRNAAFQAATEAERRVLIAKDVIMQLQLGRYVPITSMWVKIYSKLSVNGEEQVCRVIDNKDTVCRCCGLGALMLSEIRHADQLQVKSVDCYSNWSDSGDNLEIFREDEGDRLSKYFSQNQLRMIEIAFELGLGNYRPQKALEIKAKKFGCNLSDTPVERMTAIMKNIIKNNGTFRP